MAFRWEKQGRRASFYNERDAGNEFIWNHWSPLFHTDNINEKAFDDPVSRARHFSSDEPAHRIQANHYHRRLPTVRESSIAPVVAIPFAQDTVQEIQKASMKFTETDDYNERHTAIDALLSRGITLSQLPRHEFDQGWQRLVGTVGLTLRQVILLQQYVAYQDSLRNASRQATVSTALIVVQPVDVEPKFQSIPLATNSLASHDSQETLYGDLPVAQATAVLRTSSDSTEGGGAGGVGGAQGGDVTVGGGAFASLWIKAEEKEGERVSKSRAGSWDW